MKCAAGLVAHRGNELDDHLGDRADGDAEQERGQARVECRGTDPGAQDRRGAGDQAESQQPPQRRPLVRERRHDGQPFGRVVNREPDDEEGAQGQGTGAVGGPDREALAEVVQADADRDHQREIAGGRPRRGCALASAREVCVDSRQAEEGDDRPQEHQGWPAEGRRGLVAELETLQEGVDEQERKQADRQRDEHSQPLGADSAHERQPQHSQRHRDHPDVDSEQCHQREEVAVGLRRLAGNRDLVLDGGPGRGQQDDRVGLALHPRIGDVEGRRVETADAAAVGGLERDEAVVDRDLRDLDRIRAVVSDHELDLARPQHSLFDRELLDRRAGAVSQAGASQGGKGTDRRRDEQERREAEQPRRQPGGALVDERVARLQLSSPRRTRSSRARRTPRRGRETCSGPDMGSATRGSLAGPAPG
jgi:hypothetical protein